MSDDMGESTRDKEEEDEGGTGTGDEEEMVGSRESSFPTLRPKTRLHSASACRPSQSAPIGQRRAQSRR